MVPEREPVRILAAAVPNRIRPGRARDTNTVTIEPVLMKQIVVEHQVVVKVLDHVSGETRLHDAGADLAGVPGVERVALVVAPVVAFVGRDVVDFPGDARGRGVGGRGLLFVVEDDAVVASD